MIVDKETIPMTTEAKGLEALAMEANKAGRSLVATSWEKVALNALTIPLLGATVDVSDVSRQDEVPIKDDWLGAVAGLPAVSKKGLRHLSDALSEKGWVSVREAIRFVEIEETEQASAKVDEVARAKRSNAGAAMLLARAEQELPGTIGRIAEGARELAEAATSMALFTKEAAVFTGRTASAAAAWLRRRN